MLDATRGSNCAEVLKEKKKVLLVDDSPVVLAVVGEMLEDLNYSVVTSKDGHDALERIKADRFDLIITDLNMPKMDGITLANYAKKNLNCRFTPIIMLSSEEDREMIARAKEMGVSTFLSKPIKKNALNAILNIVVGA